MLQDYIYAVQDGETRLERLTRQFAELLPAGRWHPSLRHFRRYAESPWWLPSSQWLRSETFVGLPPRES